MSAAANTSRRNLSAARLSKSAAGTTVASTEPGLRDRTALATNAREESDLPEYQLPSVFLTPVRSGRDMADQALNGGFITMMSGSPHFDTSSESAWKI